MTHKNDTLFMTHRIEPLCKNHFSIWLKVLNSSNNSKNWTFFLNITQRIKPFFFEYDAKNWTLFWIWRNELNSLWTWLERIEPLFEYDSKNWISFWVWLKNIELFFLNTTQWIEPIFWMWLTNWNFGWKNCQKIQNVFYMTRRMGPAFFNMTQRIEPFSICLKDLIYSVWLQELNFFLTRTDRIGPFFLNMT